MKCKNCKEVFEPKWFNWKFCDKDLCHNLGVKELVKKEREKKAKQERKETKKAKEALLTHRDYLKLFQTVFNTYIRKRDKDLPCISCGRFIDKTNTHASHYFSVGAYPNLRFNEDNVHASCNHCNLYLHGNISEYSIKLPQRIGIERFEELKESRNKSTLKLSIPEIKELIKKYKLQIKKMDK